MKLIRNALLVSGAIAMCAPMASAQDGNWLVRGRIIGVLPDESADIDPINGTVDISDQFVPELDISYFFSDNIAVELILGVTPHDVKAVGTDIGDIDLGDVTLLPPTLTLQYHFNAGQALRPYVGAGINYTEFFNDDLPGDTVLDGISYDASFGWALQAGVDFYLDNGWILNADIKKIDISPDVTIDATTALDAVVQADVDIDPIVIGFGIGRRF